MNGKRMLFGAMTLSLLAACSNTKLQEEATPVVANRSVAPLDSAASALSQPLAGPFNDPARRAVLANYAAQVRDKILPLVRLPPDLHGNPKAVVQVVLLPTLEVRSIRLAQSSGNPAYDEAVELAIRKAGPFPPLPAGVRFIDVRALTLVFMPRS